MSNTNNNPISSVPEPSTAASSSSSNAAAADPLANIITQVSPTSAGASSRAGPARPTRVAKQQVERKKKKEKKDDGKTTAASAASAATPSAPVEEQSANDGGPALLSTEEEEQSHSQKASSTLVGTSTSKGSHVIPHSDSEKVGLTQDKPLDAAATPTEPDPAVPATSGIVTKDEPSTAGKTKNVASVAEKKSAEKGGHVANGTRDAGARSDETSSRTVGGGVQQSRSEKTGAASAGAAKRRKSKAGFMSRLLAILTCSAGSKAALQDEEEEMSEKRGTSAGARSGMKSSSGNGMKGAVAAGTSSRLSPKSAAKGSRAPSQRGSLDKTAGGGTRLPRDETGDVMSGAVVPPGSSFVVQDADGKKGLSGGGGGSGSSSMHKAGEDDEDGDADDDDGDGEDDEEWMGEEQMEDDEDQTEEQRLIMQGGAGIPRDDNGDLHPLLEPIHEQDSGRKCLVLDLDETLVHSSFKMISNADFTVPVEIEGTVHNVYVIKRPGVDEFMRKMGELYEVVVFTASLSKYADPVLDILDIHQVVRHRLFRESCYNHRGNYVKDLSQLGRDIETSIIIDNSPASYIFHPNNAVPISSWFNDPHDTELTDLCPFLAELADVQDVRAVLDGGL